MSILFSVASHVTCSVLLPTFGGDAPITITFRVNPTAVVGFQPLADMTMPGGFVDRFYFNGAASQFQWSDSVGNRFVNSSGTAGVWQHMAYVYDPGNTQIRGYMNGVQAGTDGPTRTGRPNHDQIEAGFSVFMGQDLVVYQAALTTAEIVGLMNFRKPTRTANLYAWLPMDAGATRNKDFGPNSLTFAEVGGVADGPSSAPVPWAAGSGSSFRERMTATMGRRRIR